MNSTRMSVVAFYCFVILAILLIQPRALRAASFTVDDLGDTDHGYAAGACPSPCTLRDAIKAANSNAGVSDIINFSVSGTILNTTAMPSVTDNGTTIDATGQTITVQASTITFPAPIDLDSSGNVIKGFRITGYSGDDGLSISGGANSNLVSKMVLNGNAQGLRIQGNDNTVEGCFIGTDGTGTTTVPNLTGIILELGATGNTIGGSTPAQRNIISGNTKVANTGGFGIALGGAPVNRIEGNFIGTDSTGAVALPNSDGGISLNEFNTNSSGNLIVSNVISGNGGSGILINVDQSGNTVQGNFIGTDMTGSLDLGNAQAGIRIDGAPNNIIGGTTTGAGNIISGNGDVGIELGGTNANGNVVQGNFIGTDVTGTIALGNNNSGVFIFNDADGNTVGGTTGVTSNGPCTGACNLLSKNSNGVYISSTGGEVTDTLIEGNFIGTDVTGSQNLGNAFDGVHIDGSDNTVGGTTAGAGNLIAFNSNGVNVISGTGSSIWSNSIFSNTGLGIDLNNDGVTANDADDVDTGPNNLQNFPVLTQIDAVACNTTIQGTLNSTPNTSGFRIEFFLNDSAAANGQGQHFIGFTTVDTDGNGDASFNVTLPVPVVGDKSITATATDPNNNTSEFSAEREVLGTGVSIGSIQFSSPTFSVQENAGSATITITRTGGSDCPVSVDFSTSDGTATAGADYTTVAQTITFADGDAANKTVSVPILADTLVEGDETVHLTLSNPTGGAGLGVPNPATLTIVDSGAGPVEICDNGLDDDGDALADCDDPDCASDPACLGEICDNNADDDGDGLADCADPDCASDPSCRAFSLSGGGCGLATGPLSPQNSAAILLPMLVAAGLWLSRKSRTKRE